MCSSSSIKSSLIHLIISLIILLSIEINIYLGIKIPDQRTLTLGRQSIAAPVSAPASVSVSASASASASVQQQIGLLDGKVHVVGNYIGEDAWMPCEVDLTGCGNIYFITWTKNVSNEWQRVFLYSEKYQRVLGDLQANAADRVTFRGDNINITSIAYLTIKSLNIIDEGVYKCDVTYTRPNVNGKCPSLTYTKLQTLVKPGPPLIRVNGIEINHQWPTKTSTGLSNVNRTSSSTLTTSLKSNEFTGKTKFNDLTLYQQPQIGPFAEGSTITFECETSGGRPLPDVKWWNGTSKMRSKITVIDQDDNINQDQDDGNGNGNSEGNGNGEVNGKEDKRIRRVKNQIPNQISVSTIRLIATRYDLGAKFECRVWNNATITPLTASVRLDIQVKPLNLRIRGPQQPVVAGEMVSLSCVVEGARPAANITWYNRSEVVNPHPSSTAELMSDGTYRTSSNFVFIASRHDHLGDFFCKGSNQVLRSLNEVPLLQGIHLQVLYPPAVRIQPRGSLVVNESSHVTLWCSFDANPPNVTEIVWYKDDNILLPQQTSNKNKFSYAIDSNGIPTLTINQIDKSDAGSYWCHLKNAFGRGNSTTISHIEVAYAPVVQLEIEPKIAMESPESIVKLKCLVIEGNPKHLVMVQWFVNGQLIETTFFKDGISQADQLILTNVTRFHAGNYSCRGFNGAKNASEISPAKQLNVLYAPGQTIVSISGGLSYAVKGTPATLECHFMTDSDQGNPKANSYVWTHNGKNVNNEQIYLNQLRTGPNDISTAGEYKCAPVNQVGQGKWGSIWLDVKAPPRLIQGLPPSIGSLKNQSLTIHCRVECHPLCPIQWFINNENITMNMNSQIFHIETVTHESDERTGTFGSITSYLNILNTSAIQDDDVIMCSSDDNEVGVGVKSQMKYNVEYAPINVKITKQYLELMEGESLGSNQIQCSAQANPIGNFYWTKTAGINNDPIVISHGVHLTFNSTPSSSSNLIVTRNHSSNYTCVVTNRHGIASSTIRINVLYKPECNLRREYIFDGKSILACDAVSNPPVINFTWFKGNKTISEVTSSIPSASDQTFNSETETSSSDVINNDQSSGLQQGNNNNNNNFEDSFQFGNKQTAVLVLSDNNFESYYCVATNAIGQSNSCKLQVQQITSAPSGWVQQLLSDENLMIVASLAGIIVFVVSSTIVMSIICLVKRRRIKIKRLPNGLSALTGGSSSGSESANDRHQYSPEGQHQYSPQLTSRRQQQYKQKNNYKKNKNGQRFLINKISNLEERSIPDGRCDVGLNDDLMDLKNSSPQKSPLIGASMSQSIQLIQTNPDGSPLLCITDYNDDIDDDNEQSDNENSQPFSSMSSQSQESLHHYYAEPIHLNNYHSLNYPYDHRMRTNSSFDYNIPPPRPPPPPSHMVPNHYSHYRLNNSTDRIYYEPTMRRYYKNKNDNHNSNSNLYHSNHIGDYHFQI